MIYRVMIMRKTAEKALTAVKIGVLLSMMIFCLADTTLCTKAIGESIMRCLNVVIPSLFAVMAVSSLIVKSGILTLIPKCFGRISRFLFGIEGNILPIFIFGMFAGYPVGVKMLCDEYSAGRITKKRAEILSGLCFGAGPAFIFGCISGQLYSSDGAGKVILLSNICANLLLLLIMSPYLRKTASVSAVKREFRFSAEIFTESVAQSGRAMADICIMITIFSVINVFFIRIGAAATVGELLMKLPSLDRISGEALVAALSDVTNVSVFPRGDWLLLPYISGLVSFGGVCVMFQLSAAAGRRISIAPLVIMRCTAAVMSGFVCRLIMPFFMEHETAEVSAVVVEKVRSSTPVPSLMLIIMTVMVMIEFGKNSSKKLSEST